MSRTAEPYPAFFALTAKSMPVRYAAGLLDVDPVYPYGARSKEDADTSVRSPCGSGTAIWTMICRCVLRTTMRGSCERRSFIRL
jgi:hypothetical protein